MKIRTIYYITNGQSRLDFSPDFPLSIVFETWFEYRKQGEKAYLNKEKIKVGEDFVRKDYD